MQWQPGPGLDCRLPTAESLTDQRFGAQPTQVTEVHALQPNLPSPHPGPCRGPLHLPICLGLAPHTYATCSSPKTTFNLL